MQRTHQDAARAAASAGLILGTSAMSIEQARAEGMYRATLRGFKSEHEKEFKSLFGERAMLQRVLEQSDDFKCPTRDRIISMSEYMESLCEDKSYLEAPVLGDAILDRHGNRIIEGPNTVLTAGKNFLLDNGLAGSAYTAAFFMGLISLVSFTGINAADVPTSHAGWLEAGATNQPTYSGARKTAAWAAASAGAKALSAGLVFTFTGTGTVKGCFLGTTNTVDATTGTWYSAGLFTGGDQPVVPTNTLTVSYTASL